MSTLSVSTDTNIYTRFMKADILLMVNMSNFTSAVNSSKLKSYSFVVRGQNLQTPFKKAQF